MGEGRIASYHHPTSTVVIPIIIDTRCKSDLAWVQTNTLEVSILVISISGGHSETY